MHALVQGGGKPQGAAAVLGQVEVQPACVGTDLKPHLHRARGLGLGFVAWSASALGAPPAATCLQRVIMVLCLAARVCMTRKPAHVA